MQAHITQRTHAPAVHAAAPADNTPVLKQRDRKLTQRAASSLSNTGKRLCKSVGKLFNKQRSAPPSAGAGAQSAQARNAPKSDAQIAQDAARHARQPGSRLQGGDGLRQSLIRPAPEQASSSGTAGTAVEDPAAHPAAEPVLNRSSGGRFDLRDGKLERGAQPQNTIALSATGEADFTAFTPAGAGPLLNKVIAGPERRYLAHHSQPTDHRHLLLEPSGHLLQLTQQEGSLALIRSSQPAAQLNATGSSATSLKADAGTARIDQAGKQFTMPLPGKSHLAHVTGIYPAPGGERLRLHEKRLHQFDDANAKWAMVEHADDLSFDGLAIGGNGTLYAKSDDVLVDLSSPQMPHAEVQDLACFSVAPDSTAVLISGEDSGQQTALMVGMQPGVSSPRHQKTLQLQGSDDIVVAVGLGAGRLFAATSQGRVYTAPRSDFEKDGPLQLAPEDDRYLLQGKPAGQNGSVTGFLHGDDGGLHALVQADDGSTHSYAIKESHGQLESGWNLSDALVLDSVKGLPVPAKPLPHYRLNLERAGLVALSEGRLQHWDATPQAWRDAAIGDIEHLQRSADGNAFVLKGGKLHALSVSPEHRKTPFGPTSHLAPAHRRTQVAMGKAVDGLEDRVITAFAMVTDKSFVAIDDQKRITSHQPGKKAGEVPLSGLDGDIRTLALDEKHNLYALTDTGKLFRLPKDGWQNPEASTSWAAVPRPANRPVTALHSNDDNLLSVQLEGDDDAGLMQLSGNKWHPFTPRVAEHNGFDQLFARIKGTLKTKRIPHTGGTARLDVNVMGRGGLEKGNRPSTAEFFRANVYKNTLETPRWIKNVGNRIQHSYHGREGLRPVYDAQSQVFKQLELIGQAPGTPPQAGDDLQARIARLALGPAGAELVEQLNALREELENHTYTALMAIGQEYGRFKNLRKTDGLLNLHGELAPQDVRSRMGKKLADLGNALNFKSSGHDLVHELGDALARIAPSADDPTGKLLQQLKSHGLKMSHQKADIPLGQRRDTSDNRGLSKARLALDMVTLNSLSELVAQLELPGGAQNIEALQAKLTTLREVTYGKHPLKQITDMGFTNHTTLESAYDAIKTFLKSFKKSDHATSVNLRAATGSQDQAELSTHFKAVLKQMEHGDEEISLQRSYGLNLTSPFVTASGHSDGPWPTAAATGNRNYLLTAERGEAGITVYLLSEAAGSASAGVGGGKDFWPGFFDENSPARRVDLGDGHTLTPNFRLGADLTATGTANIRKGVVFRVADEDIDGFVDDLFEGKVDPMQVLAKARDHETSEARRFTFDITASATAELRAGFNLSQTGSKPLSAIARLGAAATVNVNLLTYTDYSLSQKNDTTSLNEGGKNRPRFLNNLTVAGQARAQASGSHVNPGQTARPASQSVANNLGATVTASADSRTTKRVKFRYQVAQPLTREKLDTLSKTLAKAFTGSLPAVRMAEPGNADAQRYTGMDAKAAVDERLKWLNEIFAEQPSLNLAQYAALRELKRATVQHAASPKRHSVLENARLESNYTNLSRLDEQGMATQIIASVKNLGAPSNASRVAALIERDPQLKALLKGMQASEGTLARVRLEPKDSLLDTLDAGSRDGSLTQEQLGTLLEDRNAMRIRALTVYHTVTQADNFTSPSPLVSYNSGASVSVTKAVGRIVFHYGQDQDTPLGYSFDGEQAKPSADIKEAAGLLDQAGLVLKR